MTPNWLVDSQGRRLPESSWPADRAAPGELELVRRFCNTINRENGADRFLTAVGFDRWLEAQGRRALRPRREALARVVGFREALHAIIGARDDSTVARGWSQLARSLGDVTCRIRATEAGLRLVPAGGSRTDAFLAELALVCLRAADDGRLRRLKTCAQCEWTIYDTSKNRSARWCSMTACGGRHNARVYRRRHRGAATRR